MSLETSIRLIAINLTQEIYKAVDNNRKDIEPVIKLLELACFRAYQLHEDPISPTVEELSKEIEQLRTELNEWRAT